MGVPATCWDAVGKPKSDRSQRRTPTDSRIDTYRTLLNWWAVLDSNQRPTD